MKKKSECPTGRLSKDMLWVASGQAMAAIAMIVGTRILTELVEPAVYGQVNLLMGIALLGRQTFAFPYLQAALRFYPEAVAANRVGTLRNIISRNLLKTSGLFIILLLICGGIYTIYANKGLSIYLLVLVSGILALEVLLTLNTDFYNAARRHRHFALITTGQAWLKPTLATVAVLFWGPASSSVLSGYLIAALLVAGVIYISPIEKIGIFPEHNNMEETKAFSRQIYQYALPLVPIAVIGWISALSDRYFIAAMIDMESAGIYASAYNLMSMPFLMVQAIIERTIRPVYFNAVSSGETPVARRYFNFWILSVLGICSTGVMLAFLFSDFIVQVCLDSKYHSSAVFMPWIAIGHLFFVLSNVLEAACLAHKKSNYVLVIQLVGAIASVVIVIPFIKIYGLSGAAWAVPIYFGFRVVVAAGYFTKLFQYQIRQVNNEN